MRLDINELPPKYRQQAAQQILEQERNRAEAREQKRPKYGNKKPRSTG